MRERYASLEGAMEFGASPPEPCPFCGSTDIRCGIESAQSVVVVCQRDGCLARIPRWLPDRWPPRVYKSSCSWDQNHLRLENYCLAKALKAWNRRVKKCRKNA